MDLSLQEQNINKIKSKFKNLNSIKDLANLFEVNAGHLYYWIYKQRLKQKYKLFKLKKKNGGEREIIAPHNSLKILQSKLNYILTLFYDPKESVHGFAKGKSILTNAQKHINKKYVLNIDLEDFFPTINQGRIYGIFRNEPFCFSIYISRILARLCCVKNFLPQGAPTSPLLSNLVCRSLDNDLIKLAKHYKCTYSRYADDITLSTNLSKFPELLAKEEYENDKVTVKVGEILEKVIKKHGFKVNTQKVRLQNKYKRQEVTGLTVNEKPNINRHYVRNVRSMLYNWEYNKKIGLKNGWNQDQIIKEAEKYHYSKQFKNRNPKINKPDFKLILKGKITYIKMIRGNRDYIYAKFINKFNELSENNKPKLPTNLREELSNSLWILESETACSQGSAFYISKIGIITCAHCVYDDTKAYKESNPTKKYPVKILHKNDSIDLAIIEINDESYINNEYGLKLSKNFKAKHLEEVIIAGYANHYDYDTLKIRQTHICGYRNFQAQVIENDSIREIDIKRFLLAGFIVGGDSGCPILNKDNEVIGIAVTGSDDFSDTKPTENYGVIPIDAVSYLLSERNQENG